MKKPLLILLLATCGYAAQIIPALVTDSLRINKFLKDTSLSGARIKFDAQGIAQRDTIKLVDSSRVSGFAHNVDSAKTTFSIVGKSYHGDTAFMANMKASAYSISVTDSTGTLKVTTKEFVNHIGNLTGGHPVTFDTNVLITGNVASVIDSAGTTKAKDSLITPVIVSSLDSLQIKPVDGIVNICPQVGHAVLNITKGTGYMKNACLYLNGTKSYINWTDQLHFIPDNAPECLLINSGVDTTVYVQYKLAVPTIRGISGGDINFLDTILGIGQRMTGLSRLDTVFCAKQIKADLNGTADTAKGIKGATLAIDHIEEKTGSHNVVFDNIAQFLSSIFIGAGSAGSFTNAKLSVISSTYNNIALADTTSSGVNKSGQIVGAPKTNTNKCWSAYGIGDNGTTRNLFLGGGGWSMPDATGIYFYTAAAYNQIDNQGVLRFTIASDGTISMGANNVFKTDHIAEATGSHGVAMDNAVSAPRFFSYDISKTNVANGATVNLFSIGGYTAQLSGILWIKSQNSSLTAKNYSISIMGFGTVGGTSLISSEDYGLGAEAFTLVETKNSPSVGYNKVSVTNNAGEITNFTCTLIVFYVSGTLTML